MSFSMSPPAPPPPQHQQQAYPPYQNLAGSPTNPSPIGGPPPAKRQRMSPDPRSPPNGAPGWMGQPQPHGLPNVAQYGNPYAQHAGAVQSPYGSTPTYAAPSPQNVFNTPQSPFNTPQGYQYPQHSPSPWQSQPPTPAPPPGHGAMSPPAQQSREMMPPPPRPNKDEREERGVDYLDSLFGSGINLKDEENYMHTVYNNRHGQDSFSTNQNSSFGSTTLSPNNSFHMLTQGTSFGSQDAFASTLGPTQTEEDIEVQQRKKREKAAREQSEHRQHHLNNQFLLCNNVRKRMDVLARAQGVMINMNGVYVRTVPETSVMVNGNGSEGIVGATEETKPAESVVNQNTAFEQIVSLVSLAAGERVRGLLDEAHTLARARVYGDHGRVPPEFADIATGEGKQRSETIVPESVTGTQWDAIPSASSPPENAPSQPSTPQPQPTISFQGTLNTTLNNLATRDREAETARLKKREARKRKAAELSADAGDTPPTPAETSVSEAAAKPLTKKEQARREKSFSAATEAQTTNRTAAMMAMGKKAKQFSWMTTGGASDLPTNRFAKPQSGSGAATPVRMNSGVGMVNGAVTPGEAGRAPEWGDFGEEKAKGVEMRDWLAVLERDGKGRGVLVKGWSRLG